MHFVATFSLLLRIIVTSASVTYNGHYLPGSLYRRIFELDWMGCLQVCHDEPRCISYNYHKNKKICEINSDGMRDKCTSKQTIFSGEWIFHQIRPVPPETIFHEVGDHPSTAASSCEVIFKERTSNARPSPPSRAYYISANPGKPVLVYCKMDRDDYCGDGGWTLAMKIDGSKTTFSYNSNLWSDLNSYNESAGKDLNNTETRLDVFRYTAITNGFCVGMKVGANTQWLRIPPPQSSFESALAVFIDGTLQTSSVGVQDWKSLINGSFMGDSCFKSGFNVDNLGHGAKVRIGIVSKCPDGVVSRIGFGMDTNNTCGNEVEGTKSIKAFCYIFVK